MSSLSVLLVPETLSIAEHTVMLLYTYRTVGVVHNLAARSVTCDNAQLSEP